MTDPIVLDIVGTPEPQGNKTGFVRGGKVVMTEGRRPESRARFKSWREAVAQSAREWQESHRVPLLDEPCRMTVVFRLPRPKSAPKKRIWPATRPDVEKLARAVCDALTGIIYADDSRVCEMHLTKQYATDGPPGCTITVEVLDGSA